MAASAAGEADFNGGALRQDCTVHLRLHNEFTLEERLMHLASLPASQAVGALVPDRERWAISAKKARNALVHRTTKKGPSLSIDEMRAVAEVTR